MRPSHIVFCAAVPLEVKSLCKRLQIPVPTPHDPVTFGRHAPFNITILTSGVGIDRMMKRLRQVQPMTHSCWISYGFAGALSEKCRLGECYVGSTVQYYRHDEITGTLPDRIDCDGQMKLFCHTELAAAPAQKAELGQATQAHLVDMESYAVAVTAAQRNEPFFWIRGVSDAFDQPLPVELLQCLDQDGYPSIAKSATKIVSKLYLLPVALKVGKITHKTQYSLSNKALQILDELNEL